MKDRIQAMIQAAISGDTLFGKGIRFVSVMGRNSLNIQQDIPAAFEAYTLLSHFLETLPVRSALLNPTHRITNLSPVILYDTVTGRVVGLLPIEAAQLTAVAHWLIDHMPSDQVKKMPGLLAIPFSIEQHAGMECLLPEWFAAFYVHSEPNHCIPILTLRSVLSDHRFGGDWVNVALERMALFALPQQQATNAVANHPFKIGH